LQALSDLKTRGLPPTAACSWTLDFEQFATPFMGIVVRNISKRVDNSIMKKLKIRF
jgi:hypothetical protein